MTACIKTEGKESVHECVCLVSRIYGNRSFVDLVRYFPVLSLLFREEKGSKDHVPLSASDPADFVF